MADGFIGLPGDSTGKKLDATELVVGANTVERERMVIAGDTAAALAPVTSSGGLLVSALTSGPLQVLTSGPVDVLTSGPIQVVTSGPLQVLSSGPYLVVSASSGLVQLTSAVAISSGTVVVSDLPPSVVDPNNSSTVELGAGATFTGTATNILSYHAVGVSVFSNVASAANGMKYEFSQDGINWDHITSVSIPAGDEITSVLSNSLKFFRVVYINGATSQTVFRLQTVLEEGHPAGTVREMSVLPQAQDLAMLTRAVISGTTGGSVFTDVKVNPSGTLQVGGTIDISSGTVTLSSAPLVVVASSSPLPPIGISSGTITLSSAPIVQTASSGLVQALLSSASFAPITSSEGQLVSFVNTIVANVYSSAGAPILNTISTSPVTLFSLSIATTGAASHVLNLYNTATSALSTVASTFLRYAVLSTPGTQIVFQSAAGVTVSRGLQSVVALTMTSNTVSTAATTVSTYTNVEYAV